MFSAIIFVCLMLLLFLAGGAAVHMGVFKSHKQGKSLASKTITGILSYGFSAVFWFFSYTHFYLGW